MASKEGLVLAVTGGTGFVGSHICNLVLNDGYDGLNIKQLRVLDLKPPSQNYLLQRIPKDKEEPSLKFIRGSILDPSSLKELLNGADMLIHAASLVDFGNHAESKLRAINVDGTTAVLKAAKEANVQYIVYTSSLDTILTWEPNINTPSDAPYPSTRADFCGGNYAITKSIAEQAILKASSEETADSLPIYTCSLRPRGVYGEADPYYVVSVLSSVKSGNLKFRIGDPSALLESMYAGNVAYAHLRVLERLLKDPSGVSGRAFNLSMEPRTTVFDLVKNFTDPLGYKMPDNYVSLEKMVLLARVVEFLVALIPEPIRPINVLTKSAMYNIGVERTFDGSEFNEEFDFEPFYSLEEAHARTLRYLKHYLKEQDAKKSPVTALLPFAVGIVLVGLIVVKFTDAPPLL